MSTPKNHHYVPQTYLKSFADSGKLLYQLDIKYGSIAIKNIQQVCYIKDFYKIQREETLLINRVNDLYHLERVLFNAQENRYGNLLRQVTFPSISPFALSYSTMRLFLEVIVNIKRRNPSLKDNLITAFKAYFNSDQFQRDIQPGIEISRQVDEVNPFEIVEKYLEEINNDPSKLSDAYLSRLLDGKQGVLGRVVNTLLQYKVEIYTADLGSLFITSDNPGYVLEANNILNFGGFGGDFVFVFPLTPLCALVVKRSNPETDFLLEKYIYPKFVNSTLVQQINEHTLSVANQKVFAYSRSALDKLIR